MFIDKLSDFLEGLRIVLRHTAMRLIALAAKRFIRSSPFEARFQDGIRHNPKVEYIHTSTFNTIVLIGMTHAASKNFFVNVNEEIAIARQNGFSILQEGLLPLTSDQFQSLSVAQTEILKELCFLTGDFQVESAARNKSAMQRDEIQEEFKRADIEFIELVKAIETAGYIDSLRKFMNDIKFFHNHPLIDRVLCKISGQTSNEKIHRICKVLFKHYREISGKILIDLRNEVAVKIILEEVEKSGKVLIIYGNTHLIGLDQLLSHNGFERTETSWVPPL